MQRVKCLLMGNPVTGVRAGSLMAAEEPDRLTNI